MSGLRRAVSFVAIVAIALHGVLLSLAPLAAASAVDPLSVICHSGAQTTPSDEQAPTPDAAAHGCGHCNLCSAAAVPPALDDVLAGQLVPGRLLQVLRPVSNATSVSLAGTPKLARGPPQTA